MADADEKDHVEKRAIDAFNLRIWQVAQSSGSTHDAGECMRRTAFVGYNNTVSSTVLGTVAALSHELEREHDICIALGDSQDVDIIVSHVHEAARA